MECINGEWIMTGCSPDDPDRLKSLDELIRLIRRIGFLPLFSNSIPGFSVEERVTAEQWWTEEEKTDQQAAEHSAACLYCHAACRCGLLRRMVVAFPPAGVPAGGRALAG